MKPLVALLAAVFLAIGAARAEPGYSAPVAASLDACAQSAYRRALDIALPEARGGSADAAAIVGWLLVQGEGAPADLTTGYRWLLLSAHRRSALGQGLLVWVLRRHAAELRDAGLVPAHAGLVARQVHLWALIADPHLPTRPRSLEIEARAAVDAALAETTLDPAEQQALRDRAAAWDGGALSDDPEEARLLQEIERRLTP